MRKSGLLLLLYLLCTTTVSAQRRTDTVGWSERQLTWEDFRKKPSYSVPFGAKIKLQLVLSISNDAKRDSSARPLVRALFFPHRSWVKPEIRQADNILRHEQLHFDIVEVYARVLRKEFENFAITDKASRKKAERMYRAVNRKLHDMQSTYDRYTANGADKQVQAKWAASILLQLQQLDAYKLAATTVPQDRLANQTLVP